MQFSITKFTTSAGWLTNFKRKYNVQSYVKLGEAANDTFLEKINKYKQEIAEKLYEYALDDIYNCDEIGI
ncbi:2612_t:CDS:2 [Funneliformis mosseae]|uniref:2612_t:CDS:1 n=1 Tax=Funneliformis mosseae TaxID=27381 RepID=A0A9N9GQR1_FUNMO|nr:2612_t:CDS:2 [Funneliformis mosseae]